MQHRNEIANSHTLEPNLDISNSEIDLPITVKKERLRTQPNVRSKVTHQSVNQTNVIRRQNKHLKKQLQTLSQRLDFELQKRFSLKKKDRKQERDQTVQHMELQNAYKKCQIYKRQAEYYRKKTENMEDFAKVEQIEQKLTQMGKQNLQLKNELKYLKKIRKMQEKGLSQVGAEGYLKIASENEKLKEQVRRLNKALNDYRRNINTKMPDKDQKVKQRIPENSVDNHLESAINKNIKMQQEKNSDELVELLQQKMEKDYQKMVSIRNEKDRLRQILDNVKVQLSQKQKQNMSLKQKISSLRKNNTILQAQVEKNKDNARKSLNKSIEPGQKFVRNRYQSQRNNSRSYTTQQQTITEQKNPQLQIRKKEESKIQRYPRMEQHGILHEGLLKWNHHQFSSKIKEIKVILHEFGNIKDIHVRYQKGQPKYDPSTKVPTRIKSFVCAEPSQYITKIGGGFFLGYIQFLKVSSNLGRTEKFGQFDSSNGEVQTFQFQIDDSEYPCVIFGDNDLEGIKRLGVFIQKL